MDVRACCKHNSDGSRISGKGVHMYKGACGCADFISFFLNIPWKWNNLVSLRPNDFFIGCLKTGGEANPLRIRLCTMTISICDKSDLIKQKCQYWVGTSIHRPFIQSFFVRGIIHNVHSRANSREPLLFTHTQILDAGEDSGLTINFKDSYYSPHKSSRLWTRADRQTCVRFYCFHALKY